MSLRWRETLSSFGPEVDSAGKVTDTRTPALRRHREPCLVSLFSGGGPDPRPAGRAIRRRPQPVASLSPLLLKTHISSLEHFSPYCGAKCTTTPSPSEGNGDNCSFQREEEMEARRVCWFHEKVLGFCCLCDWIYLKEWPSVWV